MRVMDRRTFCKQGLMGLAALVLGCAEQPPLTPHAMPAANAEDAVRTAMQHIKKQHYPEALATLENYENTNCNITIDYLRGLTLVAKTGTFNPVDPDCWKSYTRAGEILQDVVERFLNNSHHLDTLQQEVPTELFAMTDYRTGKKQLASFGTLLPRLYGLLGFMSLVERRYEPACKYFAVARAKIPSNEKYKIKKFHDSIHVCGQRAFAKWAEYHNHTDDPHILEPLQRDWKGLADVSNLLIPDEGLDETAYDPHKATLRVTEQQK